MKSRIGGLMVLAMVSILAVAGMVWAVGSHQDMGDDGMQLGIAMNLWYGFEPATPENIAAGIVGDSGCGLGREHWGSDAIHGTGLHDSVAVQPDKGFYCSDDPAVIVKQVVQMESMGIDWILTSWWGWGDDDLGSHDNPVNEGRAAIDRAHRALFDHLKSSGSPVKAAIGMDNWMTNNYAWWEGPDPISAAKSQTIWDHIHTNYVDKYEDNYFMLDGKPLVTSWAPHILEPDQLERFTYKSLWPIPFDAANDSGNLVHQGKMDWSWVAPFTRRANDEYQEHIVSEDGFVTINPRYDQFFGWLQGHVLGADGSPVGPAHVKRDDPFLTEGLYDTNWKLVYGAKDQVRLVLLATWNDYHEQTQIEPSYNGPLGSGTYLMEKTRYYWSRLEKGQPFEEYEDQIGQWTSLSEFKSVVGNPSFAGLGYSTEAELNDFLRNLMIRAQSHISQYLRTTYNRDDVPEGVKELTLRLAGNLYHYTLKIKSGELYRIGDTEFRLIDDNVFTDSIKNDLNLWKRKNGVKVLYP